MNRRHFFSALAGSAAVTALATQASAPSDPPTVYANGDIKLVPIQYFDEPISGMVQCHNDLFITTGSKLYRVERS